jgi:hypothetical protein
MCEIGRAPLPWVFKEEYKNSALVRPANLWPGFFSDACIECHGGENRAADEATAKFIVICANSHHDLLRELKSCSDELELVWHNVGQTTPNRHVIEARAVIAKAEGRQ